MAGRPKRIYRVDEMKKIIFLMSSYEINGVCAVARSLMDNLDTGKFEIILLAESVDRQSFPVRDGVKLIDLKVSPQKGFIKKAMNVLRIWRSIAGICKTEKCDVVLGFGSVPSCYALLALRLFGKGNTKVIVTEHSEGLFVKYNRPGIKLKILARIYKAMIYFLYRHADYIIPVSGNMAKLVTKQFFVKEEKVKVIHNPVDISGIKKLSSEAASDITFQEGSFYLAVVSRLSKEKGIDYLIRAVAALKDKTDLVLLVIGEGREEGALRDLAARCNISEGVRFLGWKDNPFKYLSKCDLFILPSLYEGFPIVILEAMACGIPVIATRCTQGLEEIIDDHKTGILVPPRDVGALSDSIQNMLSDKKLCEEIRCNSYEKIKEFDIPRVTAQYEEVLAG